MDALSGSDNKTFEMNEVNLNNIDGTCEKPRVEFSNFHDQVESEDLENLSTLNVHSICPVEKGNQDPESFSNVNHSKSHGLKQINETDEEDYSLISFFKETESVQKYIQLYRNKKPKLKYVGKVILSFTALSAYIGYLIAILIIKTESENADYWCKSDGFLIILTVMILLMIIYFKVVKPLLARRTHELLQSKRMVTKIETFSKIYNNRYTVVLIYSIVICSLLIFLIIDTIGERRRLISAFGIIVILLFGFIFSTAPRKIVWRHVIWGMSLQFLLGLVILRWSVGRQLFGCLGEKVASFLSFTDHGSSFVFGSLVSELNILAFKVLSVILFFSCFIQILTYYGIMQWLVLKLGWLLQITVGTTACESVNAAANIFIGMATAPLIIKPYLSLLTKSELHAVMTAGFATVSGSILAAFINFGVDPAHLLSASVMSAPAALAFSKLNYPEVEKSRTNVNNIQIAQCTNPNVLHAALEGVTTAVPLVTSIATNLISFIALIYFVDAIISWPCELIGLAEGTCTLSNLFAYIFTPVAWIMGVPWEDCFIVGELIGTRTIIHAFVAYVKLGKFIKQSTISSRSIIISTYALCGFGNLTGIGIQVGVLGSMAPDRYGDLSKIAFRSMIAGSMACFLTACVAGTLISSNTSTLMEH